MNDDLLENITVTNMKLPNMSTREVLNCQYYFGNQNYYFVLKYLGNKYDDNRFYLDVYVLDNDEKIYLIQGCQLIPNVEIMNSNANSQYIHGILWFEHKNEEETEPTLTTFHTDYELVYMNNIENI